MRDIGRRQGLFPKTYRFNVPQLDDQQPQVRPTLRQEQSANRLAFFSSNSQLSLWIQTSLLAGQGLCYHPTLEKCVGETYSNTTAAVVVAVNSICRGSGLISQEAPPGALLLLPVTPGIRCCDMPYASLCFPRLPPVLLQFPLPKIYASCNWSVRRRRAEATTQILSWVSFPEQERRRKCNDLASFREQAARL